MKELEKQFFLFCIKKFLVSYQTEHTCELLGETRNLHMNELVELFSFVQCCTQKQLWYYISKWDKKGFYVYGVNIGYGWFEFKSLSGDYKSLYKSVFRGCSEI